MRIEIQIYTANWWEHPCTHIYASMYPPEKAELIQRLDAELEPKEKPLIHGQNRKQPRKKSYMPV